VITITRKRKRIKGKARPCECNLYLQAGRPEIVQRYKGTRGREKLTEEEVEALKQ
jgi:RNase adaptor protein for sRNA GlmZ degradation